MPLVSFLRKQAQVKWNFSTWVTFLRLNTFCKLDLFTWLNYPQIPPEENNLSDTT